MFKFTMRETHLSKPECAKRNDKNGHPFRAVQCPARKKTIRRNIGCAAADAKRLSSRFLAHFPNESVVIKMEQRRSRHHSGEHPFDYVDVDSRVEVTQRPVGDDQADVQTAQ